MGRMNGNPFGLFDMHGSIAGVVPGRVREHSSARNRAAAFAGRSSSVPGGAGRCCVLPYGDRAGFLPSYRDFTVGFRVVRSFGRATDQASLVEGGPSRYARVGQVPGKSARYEEELDGGWNWC